VNASPCTMNITSVLARAYEKRASLFGDGDTTCFRLVNSAGDGLDGICVDWYDGFVLIQLYRDLGERELKCVIAAFRDSLSLLPLPARGLLLKRRPASASGDAAAVRSVLIEGEYPPPSFIVRQNGVRAVVDLIHGLNTGIFLDMREVRARLSSYIGSTDAMLNLFCYTGLFSVHALVHGASSAVNVDLSKTALSRAKTNYGLNGLRVDDRDFIRGDAIAWARRFMKKGLPFTIAVFDPPTFARNKSRTFSTKRNYRESLAVLDACVSEGHVLTSVNTRSIPTDEYRSFHPSWWRPEFIMHEPSDFPIADIPYLKVGLWRVKKP